MATNEELAAAQRAIVAALAQHASHNYRASSAVVNRINAEIDRLARELALELGRVWKPSVRPRCRRFSRGSIRPAA